MIVFLFILGLFFGKSNKFEKSNPFRSIYDYIYKNRNLLDNMELGSDSSYDNDNHIIKNKDSKIVKYSKGKNKRKNKLTRSSQKGSFKRFNNKYVNRFIKMDGKADGLISPYSKRSDFGSEGEALCCIIIEEIYKKPFYSVRPEFLKNPETNRNLEIDIYNEELRLGIEYNGKQHYVFPNSYHKTYKEFINQVRRDKYKIKKCNEKGIYLISIPYNVEKDKLRDYILERLPNKELLEL